MKTFEEYKEIIDSELTSFIPSIEKEADTLRESMEYSLTAGGKRLRPVLLLASCDLAGGDTEIALPYAAAIEFIHTYSLVHDDLPAMDDDDLRRGRKTNHIVFGPGMATLAGDALLNSAFEIMMDDISGSSDDQAVTGRKIRACHEIAIGAGVQGMIAGQAADIMSDGPKSAEMLSFIDRNKTASLIKAPVRAGLYLGGADQELVNRMTIYADKLGIAFQIDDDILDVLGKQDDIGKPVGSDMEHDKVTYVSEFGLEGAKQRLHELSAEAVKSVEGIDKNGFFADLVQRLETRTK